MNISQNGIDFIKQFEGLRLTAYKAVSTEKYWTIGYGHYGSDVKQGMTITKTQAENMLKDDLVEYVDGVNAGLTRKVNQNQFDALVSFTYNVGITAFKTSTLLKRVNAYEDDDVRYQFSRWNKSGGVVYQGLVTRRAKEADLYFEPVKGQTTEPEKPPTTTTPPPTTTTPPTTGDNNTGGSTGSGGGSTGGGNDTGTTTPEPIPEPVPVPDPITDPIPAPSGEAGNNTGGNTGNGSTSGQPNSDDSKLSSPNTKTSTTYVVKKGDTLLKIADKFNLSLTTLLFANKSIKVANLIYVNQKLVIPKSDYEYYKIKAGDTLYGIAYDNKTTVSKLLTLNKSITNKNKINAGDTIRIK